MKNFMVIGDCQGCSLIADRRRIGTVEANEWNDTPWDLGYWIGTLAMEYHFLSQNGYDVSQTKKDLFYALEAINRLDKLAEVTYGYDNNISASNNRNRFR